MSDLDWTEKIDRSNKKKEAVFIRYRDCDNIRTNELPQTWSWKRKRSKWTKTSNRSNHRLSAWMNNDTVEKGSAMKTKRTWNDNAKVIHKKHAFVQ